MKIKYLIYLLLILNSCSSRVKDLKEIIEYNFNFTDSSYSHLYVNFEELGFKPHGSEVSWTKKSNRDYISIFGDPVSREITVSIFSLKKGLEVSPSQKTRKNIIDFLHLQYGESFVTSKDFYYIPEDINKVLSFKTQDVMTWELDDRFIYFLDSKTLHKKQDYIQILIVLK